MQPNVQICCICLCNKATEFVADKLEATGQLVELPLPKPEAHGSNPVIGKIYNEHCLLSTDLKRRKYRKEAGIGVLLYKLEVSDTFPCEFCEYCLKHLTLNAIICFNGTITSGNNRHLS